MLCSRSLNIMNSCALWLLPFDVLTYREGLSDAGRTLVWFSSAVKVGNYLILVLFLLIRKSMIVE